MPLIKFKGIKLPDNTGDIFIVVLVSPKDARSGSNIAYTYSRFSELNHPFVLAIGQDTGPYRLFGDQSLTAIAVGALVRDVEWMEMAVRPDKPNPV
jgi:hypothetical protein